MSNNTTKTPATSVLEYKPADILKVDRSKKYDSEVKTTFKIIPKDGSKTYTITEFAMDEMVDLSEQQDSFSLLLHDGYEANQNFAASNGVAIKVTKNDKSYDLHFYDSELGKRFDSKKIVDHHYYSVNGEYLEAIFTFLRFNRAAKKVQEEVARAHRTTLDLD